MTMCAGMDGVGHREPSATTGAPISGYRRGRRRRPMVTAVATRSSAERDQRGWPRWRGGRGCRRKPSAAAGSTELRPLPRPPDLAPGEEEGGGDGRAGDGGGKRRWGTERRCGAGTEGPTAWLAPSEGRTTLGPRLLRPQEEGRWAAGTKGGGGGVWGDLGLRTEGGAYIPAGGFGPAGVMGLWGKKQAHSVGGGEIVGVLDRQPTKGSTRSR
jgi:hypothetical protein